MSAHSEWATGIARIALSCTERAVAAAIDGVRDSLECPPWLADAAEALGEVRPEDGAPKALNWTQVLQGIRDLREERDAARAQSGELAQRLDGLLMATAPGLTTLLDHEKDEAGALLLRVKSVSHG